MKNIKNYLIILLFLFSACNTIPKKNNQKMESLYPKKGTFIKSQEDWQIDFYYKRLSEFKKTPIGHNKIVFLGNSITEGAGDWNKRFRTDNIVNRGISGDITKGIIARLEEIIYYKPIAIFLLIGINDIFNSWEDNPDRDKVTESSVASNIGKIVSIIKNESPSTKIFVQTILPIDPESYIKENGFYPKHSIPLSEQINNINKLLKANDKLNLIDLHSAFVDHRGYINIKYSNDGVHLNEAGYLNWVNFISDKIRLLK